MEPTTDLSINFINLPQAWQVSQGENVKVGVVYNPSDSSNDWVEKTKALAPKAQVSRINKFDFLSDISKTASYDVILILQSFAQGDYEAMLKAIQNFTHQGTVVILPAYFGPMRKDYDYSGWREFVRQASEIGAVIVGAHGRVFQLGDLTFWRDVPVDVFAFDRDMRSGRYLDSEALIEERLEGSAYLVAGVAALIVSKEPDIKPEQVKRLLKEQGRKVRWVVTKDSKTAYPTWGGRTMDEFERKIKSSKIVETFEGSCLDAGLVSGREPLVQGQWCLQVLNVKKAQKIATGKGVTVAILDWLFKRDAPSLKGRIVKPGSVVKDSVFHALNDLGHGTWMANELVKVAPGVKIMPVRIESFDTPAGYWSSDLYPTNLIRGIEYTIGNGADVITISFPRVPDSWQVKLDEVIQKASNAGVSIVYIHYSGKRKDVVVPRPIEFAHKGKEYVYVIGTGFFEETSFPNSLGISQTAPIVAGVVAMMKEIKPELKPAEIREILLNAGRPIKAGFKMLDAVEALQAARRSKKIFE